MAKLRSDDEATTPPEEAPASPPESGQLRVTALVNIRDMRAGETKIVVDDDEWRAIVEQGLAVLS